MSYRNNEAALREEVKNILDQYVLMFIVATEAILKDNEKAKVLFLELADNETKRLPQRLILPIKEYAKELLDNQGDLQTFESVKRTIDLLFYILEDVVNEKPNKRELKKIYSLMERAQITYGSKESAKDLYDALINFKG